MNRFVYCIETERGIAFGHVKAIDGREARELIEFLFKEAGHKRITKLELLGLNSDKIAAMGFKDA